MKSWRPLTNSLLIVDEAHNLRNPMSSTSRAIVKASFKADKRLLLTATPFVNGLQDFIPLINIIYGRYIVGTRKEHKYGRVPDYLEKKLTPESLNTFKHLLQDKVDVVDQRNPKFFPRRKDHMEEVHMTPEYYKRYSHLMQAKEFAGMFFRDPHSFYNGYRRAVNEAGKGYYSMKVAKAIPILKRGRSIIYSNWRAFGVEPIAKSLKKAGITYREFTGGTPVSKRQGIVDAFNSGEFQVLVVTKAGGEGLDLKGVRSVVVLDPTWNDAGLQQIIGRAVRYKSHEGMGLSQKQKVVNVYLMALVPPKDEKHPSPSGDVLLYDIIERKNKMYTQLLEIMKKMSITR